MAISERNNTNVTASEKYVTNTFNDVTRPFANVTNQLTISFK